MEIVQAAILKKFQNEIAVALALILLSAGIGINTASDEPYNPFESRVLKIDERMQDLINNPVTNDLANMQQDIFYDYYPWAERQAAGEQKDTFIAYLEACNQVVISLSKTGEADTSEMNELKAELI